MIETSEVLRRLEDVQLIIIKAAEVVGVILVCILGLRPHIEKLIRKNRRKAQNSKD